jgi:hypothetical protein
LKTTRLDQDHCPYCGHGLDSATMVDPRVSPPTPQPGDASVCIACGMLLVFDDDLKLQRPTPDLLTQMLADPGVQEVLKGWGECFGGRMS